MRIGNVETKGDVLAAPMAGLSDAAFRRLCAEHGAGLVYSEMVSAKGMHYKSKNTARLLNFSDEERPIAVQIFGHEPDVLTETARGLGTQFDIIDINMGCPAPKIVNNGDGSALMKDVELIGRIVDAAVGYAKVPVTVKLRKGYGAGDDNCVEAAKMAERCGAAAVTIHGRTRAQMFGGEVDLGAIARVVSAVKIPVIGNGDVDRPEAAQYMISFTGCKAVMVGRAAIGDPWIFERVKTYAETGELPPLPSPGERVAAATAQLDAAIAEKGERVGLSECKRHLCAYIKGLTGAGEARVAINAAVSRVEAVDALKRILLVN